MNTLYCGDALETLRTLPDQSVNCVVTSPPYFGLRSYLPDGVKIRRNLSDAEHLWLIDELHKRGIYPIREAHGE